MTDRNARIKKIIHDRTEEICKSPESARAYLISLGIYTEDGKLTPRYGGEEIEMKWYVVECWGSAHVIHRIVVQADSRGEAICAVTKIHNTFSKIEVHDVEWLENK